MRHSHTLPACCGRRPCPQMRASIRRQLTAGAARNARTPEVPARCGRAKRRNPRSGPPPRSLAGPGHTCRRLQPSDTPTADMIASATRAAAPERWHRNSGITRMRRPSGCAGRASSPPSRPRSDRLHGTQDRAASRSGTRAVYPAPEGGTQGPGRHRDGAADGRARLDHRAQHPTTQPEEQ